MKSKSKTKHPLNSWFDKNRWTPFPFQNEAWQAYDRGKSGLIHAPTGLGKTYAAFGGPMRSALAPSKARGLRVLWITPLRALAGDTQTALQAPLEALKSQWVVDVRHGDTSAYRRRKQRERLPEVLITTPESLTLLLTYENSNETFRSLECIIVDEWHELLGTKRGTQTELTIARLRCRAPELRIWGLSATLGNLEEAKRTLLGNSVDEGILIEGDASKKVEITTLLPDTIEHFPWSGHLGGKLADKVIERIEAARSTLVFTNTRNQSELWYKTLMEKRPEWETQIGLHHGSINKEQRKAIETGLREGTLKGAVCTSSLDLGVDFSPVDQVIQVGSPKGVARLLQRAGRSGHRPGETSKLFGVPTNALEIVEFAAAREALMRKEIESRSPLKNPIDVLVQHLVSMALNKHSTLDTLKKEIYSTHAFSELSEEEWSWAVHFVTEGGNALKAYENYKKVFIDPENQNTLTVPSNQTARFHRMSIGTITGDSEVLVKLGRGRTLGTVEENFISKLKPNDTFQFAGRRLALVRITGTVATVKIARSKINITPAWQGGRSPLSSELAHAVSRKLKSTQNADPEMRKIAPLLAIQQRYSKIPNDECLLIETTPVKKDKIVTIFPFAGRLVNEGLAALFAYRLTQIEKASIRTSINDYGICLQINRPIPIEKPTIQRIINLDTLSEDLLASMNATELARRQFREIARVAGLVMQGYPGQQKSTRQLQLSSQLLFDVFQKYDPENCLLAQAEREILDRQLEYTRLYAVLKRLNAIPINIQPTERLTPMAFPLWAEQLQTEASSESWLDRIARLSQKHEEEAQCESL